jgi:hypothetical protein
VGVGSPLTQALLSWMKKLGMNATTGSTEKVCMNARNSSELWEWSLRTNQCHSVDSAPVSTFGRGNPLGDTSSRSV